MTVEKLCADAEELALGAQRAAAAGNMEAFVELITAAAQLVKLARLLQPVGSANPEENMQILCGDPK